MKAKLNSVTLVCIDCYNYGDAITAIRNSMDQCDFASVKFITDIEISLSGIEVVKIPKIKSKIEYSKFSGIAWVGDEGFYYSGYDKPKNDAQKFSAKTEYQKIF
jgi:hypothetical protein